MLPTKMLAAQTLKMWLPFLRRRRKTKGSKYQAKTKIKFLHGIVHLFLLFVKHCFAITTKFAFLNILLKKNCSFFAFCHRFNSFTKEYSMLKIVILKPQVYLPAYPLLWGYHIHHLRVWQASEQPHIFLQPKELA